jgi:ubiquitin C-terminal hydrolase
MSQCLHCEKRIGFLKKPVDGAYCSDQCRDQAVEKLFAKERDDARAREAIAEVQDREVRMRERERLEYEAAMLRGKSDVVPRPTSSETSPCPKCSSPWTTMAGAGALGTCRGRCGRCGFSAEFVAIEQCPNCRCQSLVVESDDDARCPRCKSRPRRRRQIA